MTSEQINLELPIWDQNTFLGRLKHFFWITDPRTVLVSQKELFKARDLINDYKNGQISNISVAELRYAQKLHLSAFHPDTGDLQNIFGRMSFQVPGGMALTGALLAFYKTTPQVVFWQWVNQTFNAVVNYTNRNAKSSTSEKQIAIAYASATISAVLVSLGLKRFLANRVPPFAQRFVPFAAVAAANMVNLPLMRQNEIFGGITCYDQNNNEITKSKYGACKSISQVVLSRITIAAPGMILTPFIMERLEKTRLMLRYGRIIDAPLQTLFVGCFLIFMVPVGCALYPQKCSIKVQRLSLIDREEHAKLKSKFDEKLKPDDVIYFNKGL